MSTVNLQQRLNDLFGHIRKGKIIEAMHEFYDADTVMQENAHPPMKGLATNIEPEKQFMSGVKELTGFTVTAFGRGRQCDLLMSQRVTLSRPVACLVMLSRWRWRSGRTARSYTSGSITTPR